VELAERMIRMSGLEPGLDIEVVFTGMRPGERLNEILFASQERPWRSGSPASWRRSRTSRRCRPCRKWLAALEEAIATDDRATIRVVLKDAVPSSDQTPPRASVLVESERGSIFCFDAFSSRETGIHFDRKRFNPSPLRRLCETVSRP